MGADRQREGSEWQRNRIGGRGRRRPTDARGKLISTLECSRRRTGSEGTAADFEPLSPPFLFLVELPILRKPCEADRPTDRPTKRRRPVGGGGIGPCNSGEWASRSVLSRTAHPIQAKRRESILQLHGGRGLKLPPLLSRAPSSKPPTEKRYEYAWTDADRRGHQVLKSAIEELHLVAHSDPGGRDSRNLAYETKRYSLFIEHTCNVHFTPVFAIAGRGRGKAFERAEKLLHHPQFARGRGGRFRGLNKSGIK